MARTLGFLSGIFNFCVEAILAMTTALKHYLNPLHVYCRLRDIGIAKKTAISLCRLYERTIFNLLFIRGQN